MLQPKRVKWRRPHIIKYEGLSKAGNTVDFGTYGLQAIEGNYVSDRQIEACRIVLSRYTKRQGQVWIRIFPHLAKTKKPAEVRMIGGVPDEVAIQALKMAAYKLPLKTRVIKKEVK